MKTLEKMDLLIGFGCVVLLGAMSAPAQESDPWEGLERCFWVCRSPDDSGRPSTARDFARARGKTDAELAEKLLEIIKKGTSEDADAVSASQAQAALWHLAEVGGEKEAESIREVMRTAKNRRIRRVAIHVGMRMAPGKWEEWVREVADDPRSEGFDRYIACSEAVRIGVAGDVETRQRVREVVQELAATKSLAASRDSIQEWIDELEKVP